MECKSIEVHEEEEAVVPKSINNSRIFKAITSGESKLIQQYNDKTIFRYENRDEEGTIVVFAEKIPYLSGRTERVDFSWHKVVTSYTLHDKKNHRKQVK